MDRWWRLARSRSMPRWTPSDAWRWRARMRLLPQRRRRPYSIPHELPTSRRSASAVGRTSPHCTNRSRHVSKETLDQLIQIIGRPHSPPMCELMWWSLDKCNARAADSGTLRPWEDPSVNVSASNSPYWGRLHHNTGQSCWRDLDG